MPELEGLDPAPAVESSGGDYLAALQSEADAAMAALDGLEPSEPQAAAEAPTDASSETVVSDAGDTVPDPVDGALDGDDDEPITRRNARELVAKAREAERLAIERAQQAEQEKAQHETRQRELLAQAERFIPSKEHYDSVITAVKRRDWNTLDSIRWMDEKGQEQQGFRTLDDALDYVDTLDRRAEQASAMLDYWKQAFMQNTGAIWSQVAAKEGVDKAIVLGPDMSKALEHLYDAGATQARTELQGKIDALEAENKALRAKSGALSRSPEAGGQGGSEDIPRTVKDLERMPLKDFERNFNRILEAIP